MYGFRVMVVENVEKSATVANVEKKKVQSSGGTHVGNVRSGNEDRYHVDDSVKLYAVSDGMGGHDYGELCAQECIEGIKRHFKAPKVGNPRRAANAIGNAILKTNQSIHKKKDEDPKLRNAGGTLVAAHVTGDHVVWANAGDSRLYVFNKRDQRLEQVTKDQGIGHILTNSMGLTPLDSFKVDKGGFHVSSGDVILLCSDGLTDEVTDRSIASILRGRLKSGLKAAQQELIDAALHEGGRDNITVVLVQIP